MNPKVEILKISEKEYQVGPINLKLIYENISFTAPKVSFTLETAQKASEVHLKFHELINEPINVLIDLNNAEKGSSEVRKFWEKVGSTDKYHKIAFCGLHPVARVLAAFEIGISKIKHKMHFFKTKEEAIKWLKEK